ncbi:hypothetical protein Tco_1216823 [Tanacetum coccineum]
MVSVRFRIELIAYSDSDMHNLKYCKSTSVGMQFPGGKLVSWSSKKQDCIVMSTVEAEYVSLSACLIIMAQQQHATDVHPDELCPPNKRYDLMDANKKVDLERVQCPPESKILTNIIKNHPLRFSIAASSSVPWIYMAQFWHTLKEDGSKYRLKFMLDKKELSLTRIPSDNYHLLHANDNNHNSFMPPPSFSDMVPFYKQQLGFTMELKTSSSFKTTGLLQSCNQEQVDDYDFWTDSYALDDDEILMKQVSQDIMEEVSLTIDEAKLKKMADEMLRQRCTSGDEHQYHIDQMNNFLKSDILEKGSSGPEKIVLSLHKFPALIFNDNDIEERTSRWVNKCVKKFNPYARYGVEH